MRAQMQTAGFCDGVENQAYDGPCNNQQPRSVANDELVSPIDHRQRHSMFRKLLLPDSAHLEVYTGEMEAPSTPGRPSRAPSPSRSARSFRTVRHRKGAESLQSLRFSIFGPKTRRQRNCSTGHNTPDHAKTPYITSDAKLDEDRTYTQADFQSEHEYYLHLKKQTISPPFNFQHVTHTVRKQLPSLDKVDEKDLPARFWAVSAYQTPRKHLNGIKADDITQSWLPMISRPSSVARPRSLGVSDHRSSKICHSPTQLVRYADSSISYGKLGSPVPQLQQCQAHLDKSGCALSSFSPIRSEVPGNCHDSAQPFEMVGSDDLPLRQAQTNLQDLSKGVHDHSNQLTKSSEATFETAQDESDSTSWLWISTQFPQPPTHRRVDSFVAVPNPRRGHLRDDQLMRLQQPDNRSDPALKSSAAPTAGKRIESFHRVSPELSVSGTEMPNRVKDEKASWEDDIDYAYGQKLESTCNFDWAENIIAVRNKYKARATPRSQQLLFSCASTNNDSEESLASALPPIGPAFARSHFQVAHRTRPSVGHHGFVEARKARGEVLSRNTASVQPKLHVAADGPGERPLSPMLSIASMGDRLFSQMPSSKTSKCTYSDCLSDPESVLTRGSGHRKSSSCSSCESFRQLSSSSSSTPDLLSQCKLKGRFPLDMPRLGHQDQEQTPEQASGESHEQGSPELRRGSEHGVAMTRRLETPGERAVLGAASVAAKKQQRSPATPSNTTCSQRATRTGNDCLTTHSATEQPKWI
ncbi:hypothetical protein K431DRAFT_304216 [Polychaeton citri CBS 116435]|uniref:CRIB domain-containing protein n=1 Tax=Polychaeton citri CBS 116435 TaxID=1314669 RepID=A0A9P4UPA1_9PEZI|nr:hypothetical protein K431DRAFT_304216 [Polychaeton citri CBS 116435]